MKGTETDDLPDESEATSRAQRSWLARALRRAAALRAVESLIALALLGLAAWAIQDEMRRMRWSDVRRAVGELPDSRVVAAVLLTALGFLVLTAHDSLALRYVRQRLAYRRSAFASFIGYAFSQALGFPLLTGGSLRYRLYSGWGLPARDVRDMVAFYTTGFWLGFLALGGVVLLIEPIRAPALFHLPFATVRPLGLALLLLAGGYLAWAARPGPPLRLGRWQLRRPGPRLALGQTLVAVVDWAIAGGVFWMLLPSGLGLSYPAVLAIFMIAQIGGIVSHLPGGLGVFEALVLVLLPDTIGQGALLASLLLYRVVYYVLPLVTAAGALAAYEAWRRRHRFEAAALAFDRGVSLVVPQAMAIATFVAGLVLLFANATPEATGRMASLVRLLPLPVIEASHFATSVSGGGLLILAWGLRRRLDAAWHLAVALLAAAVVLALFKGLDWEQAVLFAVMLVALLATRDEFFRRTSLLAEPFTAEWGVAVALALAAAFGLGLLAYRHETYAGELWWRFALDADAPRFLRGAVGALVAVLAFAAARLLSAADPVDEPEPPGQLEAVRDIVAAAPNAYARLALMGDKRILLDPARTAFVMYAVEGRSWIALGDPVGDPARFGELIWRFRELADRHGGWAVFYQARPQSLPLYLDPGFTLTKIGEEARVPLADFGLEGGDRRGLRRTVRKVEEVGASFEVLEADDVARELPRLRAVSDAWLAQKATREKGFSLGFFSDEYMLRGPVAVARVAGEIVAFANVVNAAPGTETTVDLMRYVEGGPDSVMEYLLVKTMLWGRERGYQWFTLGMAPLAGVEARPLAPLWNRFAAGLFRHGEHFYNFEGLRLYKEKFDPVWDPRYLASPGGLALPRVLTNVATLIGGGVRGVLTR